MTLSVERQVIKDAEGKIKFWRPRASSREHYHIRIWIEGPPKELDQIDHVDYQLHPSFRRPTRTSSNRDDNFSITVWTWGMFMINVTIHTKDGFQHTLQYYLSYELPADEGTNYIAVEP